METGSGPITTFLEAAATAVGVGLVLGGFVAGLAGLLRGVAREELELLALKGGYVGAAACLASRAVELAIA